VRLGRRGEKLGQSGKKTDISAGTTSDVKSLLFQYAWYLKKQGYADSTISSRVKLLKLLAKRGADLFEPESVKGAIARQSWCNKRKMNAVDAYTVYLRMTNRTWDPPRYKHISKLPFLPNEQELDDLIAGCGPKTSTILRLLKETAMRIGEAHKLTWIDIDFESHTIRVTPEKGSNPRIFKVSNKLLNMLSSIQKKNKVQDPNRIFSKDIRTIRRLFEKQRVNLARKLQNPRLKRIHFHTFRHWKATTLYHQTKDILYVMNYLGHRNIKNTMVYIQLEEAIFREEDDTFICKVAKTVEEAKTLIETGFNYVCELDGVKLFRKRQSGVGVSKSGVGGI
jgi:integrase